MRFSVITILFYLFSIVSVFSNETGIIEYLSADQGLSQNEVTTVLQDRNGFMWFGTRGGLNRYDGYEFVQFNSKAGDENHLSNPSIECMFEDKSGNFWVGTKSGGLNYYDSKKETFTHITHFGKNNQAIGADRIVRVKDAPNGNIFIGTWPNGMFVLDYEQDTLLHFFDGQQIKDFYFDKNGYVWIGANGNLYKMNLKDYSYKAIKNGGNYNVNEMAFDGEDCLWIVGWGMGLVKLNVETLKTERYRIAVNTPEIGYNNNTYSVIIDQKKRVWVGTWGSGIFVFDKVTTSFSKVEIDPNKDKRAYRQHNIILDICEDQHQNIWVTCDPGGIVKIGGNPSFKGISIENNPDCGLSSFHVISMYETIDSTLFIGTFGGGLYTTKDKRNFQKIDIVNDNRDARLIKHIFEVNDSTLWIFSSNYIYLINLKDRDIKMKRLGGLIGRTMYKSTCALQDKNDLLIGTQQNGFYLFNDSLKSHLVKKIDPTNSDVLKNERITFIEKDLDNQIWVGTYKGIYFFNLETKKFEEVQFANETELTSDVIQCWNQAPDSSIWLGTLSGLNRLTHDGDGKYIVQNFYREDGLPSDYIDAIMSSEDRMWMSTTSGLASVDLKDFSITPFDQSDGLHGLYFSDCMSLKGNDGTIYFGGVTGFNYFKPSDIKINKDIPPIVLTHFKIYNQDVEPGDLINGKVLFDKSLRLSPEIKLGHKEKEFSIEFAALNYNSSDRNQYAYKMEGYDNDWIEAGTRRSVTYINLKAGDYVFRVKGSNNNNVWNDEGTSVKIHIKPSPWRSRWAIIAYLLIVLGTITLIQVFTVKQVQLSNRYEVEKVQHAQEKRISEMKFQFFTNISHEFRTPLTLIIAPLKEILKKDRDEALPDDVVNRIGVVHNNAKRLMNLVNQLLDFRKAETGNMKLKAGEYNLNEFINELCLNFRELAVINGIDFRVTGQVSTSNIWFDREKMESILNNLISNAFKFIGEHGRIVIDLVEDKNHIELSVSDNGRGIAKQELEHIFDRFYQVKAEKNYGSTGIGLALVKSMVELHYGTIKVQSVSNLKTSFIIVLPKGDKHLSDDEKVLTDGTNAVIDNEPIVSGVLSGRTKTKDKPKTNDVVLVVEDNDDVNQYIKELLEPYFIIETAFDGLEGYKKCVDLKPQLIISDVMMPKVDGFEFCKRIKSNETLTTIPVILLTAKNASEFKIMGTQSGADEYISKPFDPNFLIEKANQLIENSKKLQKQFSKKVLLEPTDVEISSGDEKFIENAIALIEENLQNEGFTSDKLAQMLFLSESTLYRKLKKLTNKSTAEFIRMIRIKRATQLLADKNKTITEIAFEVGFSDVKHFRSVFKKINGVIPSEYRKGLN